jgi:nuclear pore complex protein Nup133
MPVSGKITYWESISSAATLDLIRQQRHGVEDSISGMFSGERVIQIVNAESAGFVIAFSSGRIAYMSVRDGHGRPAISVQFLRTSLSSTNGGLFGSIRHALSHSAGRGDIAAIHAERSSKVGERNIVAVTSKGKAQAWKIHRGGHYDTIAETELRDNLVSAIYEIDPVAQEYSADSFEVIDFAFVPKGVEAKYMDMTRLSDAMVSEDSSLQHLLFLVSLSNKRTSRYVLVEVILSSDGAKVGMVRPITSYSTRVAPVNPIYVPRPRLYLPKPALVSFLVFERTVVVASIATPPESPDAQLHEDSNILPATYEDVVDLRDDNVLEILGSGFEEPPTASHGHDESRVYRHKTKNPAVVLIVRGAGLLRITTADIHKFASDRPPQVTAKIKLEQAVFFGVKKDNPLTFDGRREIRFSDEEVAEAALQLSQEILASTTPHIATLPTSLDENLTSRIEALDRLAKHLKTMNVQLDKRTKWTLLWNAEKMVVANLLWQRHSAFIADRPANDKKSLVAEIVEFIHEDQKKDPNAAVGEVDRVRHWFIHDVWRLEIFVAWAYEVIKYLHKDHLFDDNRITRLLHEAVQINLSALLVSYQYRQSKLAAYGLEGEKLEMGILKTGYEGLQEPWTGSSFISNNLKRLLELCHQWLQKYYVPKGSDSQPNQPNQTLLKSIYTEMASLTDIYLISILEHSRWAVVSSDQKKMQWGQHCAKTYQVDVDKKTRELVKLLKWDEGIAIAEKHQCFPALAALVVDYIHVLNTELELAHGASSSLQELVATMDSKEKQLIGYFDKYGEPFAFEAYEFLLRKMGVSAVLDFAYDKYGYKTQFLRNKPELAKISWINDIESEHAIDTAAETLLSLGLTREQKIWNKKIELSLGKLALLAESTEGFSQESSDSMEPNGNSPDESRIEKVDKELAVIKIQDDLYAQVFPTVRMAVDETAELDLAVETHGINIPKKQKALLQVFENGMRRLLKHEALDAMSLIDMLTLIHLQAGQKEGDIESNSDQFYLALLVADYSLKGEDAKQARRLIWRRCFIRDDWSKINNTQLKHDSEVLEQVSQTALFNTLLACYTNGSFKDTQQNERSKSVTNRVIDRSQKDPFQPPKPFAVQGVYIDNLDQRFDDMEKSFRDKLIDAMKWEDAVLRKYMDKSRLEEWTRSTAETARTAVNELADEATRNGADLSVASELAQTNGKTNGVH